MKNKSLLITTSTLPRWKNDTTPKFILDFSIRLKKYFSQVTIIAPHYNKSLKSEIIEGVEIIRFQYFFPDKNQDIVYESQGVRKISMHPLYILKLAGFILSHTIKLIEYGRRSYIINAHWLIPQGFLAVISKPITKSKVVVTVHGGDVFSVNGRIMSSIKRFTLKKADAVVVNSSATKKRCKEIFDGRDYPVIPMGVDIERFMLKKPHRKRRKFKVIFIGRLSEEKGVIYLLKAAKLLQKKKDIEFSIVGSGPLSDSLKQFVIDSGLSEKVRFYGWISHEDLPALMHESDVLVGPSVTDQYGAQEAFGLVFVEAAAAGLPVIASRVGGIEDIIIEGETGYLVDQKDYEGISDKILLLMDNSVLRKRMGKNAQSHSVNYSWHECTRKYKVLFSKL